MKQSGKLSGNEFKSNGKSYTVEEKVSVRSRNVSEDVTEKYNHITRIAYDDLGNRVGILESGVTGKSFVLTK